MVFSKFGAVALPFWLLACAHHRSPAPTVEVAADAAPAFDTSYESNAPPFEGTGFLRGEGLFVDGLRWLSPDGSIHVVVASFEDGEDIELRGFPVEDTPRDWLSACSKPGKYDAALVSVELSGASAIREGDALTQDGERLSLSMSLEQLSQVVSHDEPSLSVCGRRFVLLDRHRGRLGALLDASSKRSGARASEVRSWPERCERGDGAACRELGATLNLLRSTEHHSKALDLFSKACDLGDGEGCYRLGLMIEAGQGTPKDEQRGLGFHATGCDLHDRSACLALARGSMRLGQEPAAFELAAQAAAAACDAERPVACEYAAWLHALGFGPAEQAVEMMATACRASYPKACKAVRATEACVTDNAAACVQLGAAADKELRRHWLRRACDLGHQKSCQDADAP